MRRAQKKVLLELRCQAEESGGGDGGGDLSFFFFFLSFCAGWYPIIPGYQTGSGSPERCGRGGSSNNNKDGMREGRGLVNRQPATKAVAQREGGGGRKIEDGKASSKDWFQKLRRRPHLCYEKLAGGLVAQRAGIATMSPTARCAASPGMVATASLQWLGSSPPRLPDQQPTSAQHIPAQACRFQNAPERQAAAPRSLVSFLFLRSVSWFQLSPSPATSNMHAPVCM